MLIPLPPSVREAIMAHADPAAPIPADLGRPLHTFQASGPGSFFGSLLAFVTRRKNPFGLLTITVCESGMASRDTRVVPNPNVLQNMDVRWDDLVAARSSLTRTIKGIFTSDFNIYVYDLADGTTFEFFAGTGIGTGLKDADRLAGLIQDEIFKRQLPRQSAAFNGGQAVSFGRVILDQKGLQWDATPIPWDAIARVRVHNGKFIVERAGAPALQTDVYDVKNFDILWTLLQPVLGANRMG
jgi:hypothetical protein